MILIGTIKLNLLMSVFNKTIQLFNYYNCNLNGKVVSVKEWVFFFSHFTVTQNAQHNCGSAASSSHIARDKECMDVPCVRAFHVLATHQGVVKVSIPCPTQLQHMLHHLKRNDAYRYIPDASLQEAQQHLRLR